MSANKEYLRRNQNDATYGGRRMGVASYTYRNFSLQDTFQELKSLGLSRIEIYPDHCADFNEKGDPAVMKKMLADAEMECVGYGLVFFNSDEAYCESFFKFAKEMNLEYLSADPEPESFPILDRLVKKYNVKVVVHNHGPGARYDKLEDVRSAIKDRDERIGACVDTGHFIRSGEDPSEVIRQLNTRVLAVHIKDVADNNADAPAGTGSLNVYEVLKALNEIGFTGHMGIEYESEPENPSVGVAEGLAVVKACMKLL